MKYTNQRLIECTSYAQNTYHFAINRFWASESIMLSLIFQFLFCLMLPINGLEEIINLCIKSALVAYRLHFRVLFVRKRLKSLFLAFWASSVNWPMGRRADLITFPPCTNILCTDNTKDIDLHKSWLFLMHMLQIYKNQFFPRKLLFEE